MPSVSIKVSFKDVPERRNRDTGFKFLARFTNSVSPLGSITTLAGARTQCSVQDRV